MRLTEKQIAEIQQRWASRVTHASLAAEYGVPANTISYVINRRGNERRNVGKSSRITPAAYRIAHAELSATLGRAPTICEMAAHVDRDYVVMSRVLKSLALPFTPLRRGSKNPTNRYARLRAAHDDLCRSLGRPPSPTEMAKALGVSRQRGHQIAMKLGLRCSNGVRNVHAQRRATSDAKVTAAIKSIRADAAPLTRKEVARRAGLHHQTVSAVMRRLGVEADPSINAQRTAAFCRLREAGYGYDAIGKAMGVCAMTAWRYVNPEKFDAQPGRRKM